MFNSVRILECLLACAFSVALEGIEPQKPTSQQPWADFPTKQAVQPVVPGAGQPQLPDAPAVLRQGEHYIIPCSADAFLRASPRGHVTVLQAGPMKVMNCVFVGGSGKPELRDYTQGDYAKTKNGDPVKLVFVIEPLVSGQVELILTKSGAKGPEDELTAVIQVEAGQGPRPPPTPPGPTPPTPEPVTPKPLRVLVVVKDADATKLPHGQQDALYADSTRTYLNTHCININGAPERRYWDLGADAKNESKEWQDLFAAAPKDKLPWILISQGGPAVYSGPLPGSPAEMLKLLKQFGGD